MGNFTINNINNYLTSQINPALHRGGPRPSVSNDPPRILRAMRRAGLMVRCRFGLETTKYVRLQSKTHVAARLSNKFLHVRRVQPPQNAIPSIRKAAARVVIAMAE